MDINSLYKPTWFRGKRCVVTGANRGLGLAITEALVAAGANVVACVRRYVLFVGTLQSLKSAIYRSSDALSALGVDILEGVDVCDTSAVKKMAETIAAAGAVDVVINNAGESSGCLASSRLQQKGRSVRFCGFLRPPV